MANRVEVVSWIDGAGTEHAMDFTTGCVPLFGRRGRMLAPVEMTFDNVLGGDGAVVRNVRYGAREVFVPVGFVAASGTALDGVLHRWEEYLDPAKGQGQLVVEYGYLDGGFFISESRRALDCYYVGGLEGAESDDGTTPTRLLAGLVFRAVDPYWKLLDATVKTFPLTGDSSDFTTGQERAIVNTGNAPTWPVWEITTTSHGITGPVLLYNLDTNQTITYNANLATSTVLQIDTRPGSRACRTRPSAGSTWTNKWGSLDPASEFWSLAPGSNLVAVFLTGWTSPKDFTMTATFNARYLGL